MRCLATRQTTSALRCNVEDLKRSHQELAEAIGEHFPEAEVIEVREACVILEIADDSVAIISDEIERACFCTIEPIDEDIPPHTD